MRKSIPLFALCIRDGVLSFLPQHVRPGSSVRSVSSHRVKLSPLHSSPLNTTYYGNSESEGDFSAYLSDDYRYAFMEPLLQWAVNSGVEFAPGTEIVANDEGDWGIELVKSQQQGTPILTIPNHLILSTLPYQRTKLYDWMKKNILDPYFLPEFLLVVRLLEELAKGESSRWDIWIQSLPTEFTTGMFLDSFERSHVMRIAPKFLQQQEKQWQTCNSLIDKLARDSEDVVPPNFRKWLLSQPNISTTVQWALSIVLTRSWRTPDGSHATIVPLGDMFNHHSKKANVRPSFRARDNALQICLTKDVRSSEGEPVEAYLSYGLCHHPARFLVSFGFCDTTASLIDAHVDRYLLRNGLPPISNEKFWPPIDQAHLVVSTENGVVSEDVWIVFLLKILRERDPSQVQRIQSAYDNENDVGVLGALFDELFRDWELPVALELKDHFNDILDNIYPAIAFSNRDRSAHPRLSMIERYNDFMRKAYLQAVGYLDRVIDQTSKELARTRKS